MYPLKFHPVFQERIWGGRNLVAVLGRPVPASLRSRNVGESWELADLPPGSVGSDSAGAASDGSLSSTIGNGPLQGHPLRRVLKEHGEEIFGPAKAPTTGYFPLLIKFLDARRDLSVQVHPDAAYVKSHPGTHLKSEAWYVLAAEPGAKIYKGVKPGVDAASFKAALADGTVANLLQTVAVKPGDCHYLASGTVHALGAGVLVAEVQTPSDTTFRVFDWNRLGSDGKPRKLHVAEALEVINFGAPAAALPPPATAADKHWQNTPLVHCEYFTLQRRSLASGVEPLPTGRALVWIVLAGQALLQGDNQPITAIAPGETVLLPAKLNNPRVNVVSPLVILEAALPD